MTLGIAPALANSWLDDLDAGVAEVYVQLHTGDPGAAGATAVSGETTRKLVTWDAAAAGSKAMSGAVTWSGWNVGSETVTHASLWSALSGGSFHMSGQLSVPKVMSDGDSLVITSLVLSISPLSA